MSINRSFLDFLVPGICTQMMFPFMFFILVLTAAPQAVRADTWSVVPRLSTGVMFYDFQLDDTVAAPPAVLGGFQASGDGSFSVDDQLYFGGGGVTATFGRFFIDAGGLMTTEGESGTPGQTASVTNVPLGLGAATVLGNGILSSQNGEAHFDRKEIAAVLGYSVTDTLKIFVGYKYAETDFDINYDSTANLSLLLPGGALGTFTGSGKSSNKSKFEQYGPFIGAGYSVPMENFHGAFLINTAVSYLSADVSQKLRSNIDGTFTVAGVARPTDPIATSSRGKGSGTSLGINTGIGWSGRVPSTGIGYLLGADGSFYNFEADDSDSDFREITWRLRFELSHAF